MQKNKKGIAEMFYKPEINTKNSKIKNSWTKTQWFVKKNKSLDKYGHRVVIYIERKFDSPNFQLL